MTGAATAVAIKQSAGRAPAAAVALVADGGSAVSTGPNVALAVVLGTLFAIGTYLVLRRDVVRVVWGVAILSQAANVYLVTMGGLTPPADPPVGNFGPEAGPSAATDPLVQALVLTAIVIGFGTTALALVLTYRTYEEHGTIDTHEIGAMALADEDPAENDEGDGPDGAPSAAADGGRPTRSDGSVHRGPDDPAEGGER